MALSETYFKERAAKRKLAGICLRCSNATIPGTVLCKVHTEMNRSRVREINIRERRDFKKKCVEYKGGSCFDCDLKPEFVEVYDFHHREAGSKTAQIVYLIGQIVSWDKIVLELDKCDLLCSNCHRIQHAIESSSRVQIQETVPSIGVLPYQRRFELDLDSME